MGSGGSSVAHASRHCNPPDLKMSRHIQISDLITHLLEALKRGRTLHASSSKFAWRAVSKLPWWMGCTCGENMERQSRFISLWTVNMRDLEQTHERVDSRVVNQLQVARLQLQREMKIRVLSQLGNSPAHSVQPAQQETCCLTLTWP